MRYTGNLVGRKRGKKEKSKVGNRRLRKKEEKTRENLREERTGKSAME
jgi:hypothetical protein